MSVASPLMKSHAARIAVAAVAVLLIAGCSRTNIPQSQSGDGSLPANFQLVTDIPIPANASMDNERSLILSDRDRWTGRVVMKFWQNTAELTSFYQSQMPAFGWEPVMTITSETSVLSYTRADRAATVQVEKSMLGLNSMVSVTVAPRQGNGPGPAPSSTYQPTTGYEPPPSRQTIKSETLNSPNRR